MARKHRKPPPAPAWKVEETRAFNWRATVKHSHEVIRPSGETEKVFWRTFATPGGPSLPSAHTPQCADGRSCEGECKARRAAEYRALHAGGHRAARPPRRTSRRWIVPQSGVSRAATSASGAYRSDWR